MFPKDLISDSGFGENSDLKLSYSYYGNILYKANLLAGRFSEFLSDSHLTPIFKMTETVVCGHCGCIDQNKIYRPQCPTVSFILRSVCGHNQLP